MKAESEVGASEYEPLKGFESEFEIETEYPFHIRRKRDGYSSIITTKKIVFKGIFMMN